MIIFFHLPKGFNAYTFGRRSRLVLKNIMKKDIKIYIDIIDNNTIQGWYINPDETENNNILLYLDGQFKLVTIANIERQDVADAHGKLESGFCFDIKKFPIFHNIEIRTDNDELLLSLDHTQQTVEVSSDSSALATGSIYSQQRHDLLEEITIDLSRPVNGHNWYDIEPSGRWGGPELESALKIPALSKGNFRLQLDIASAFCDLDAVQVIFNDKPVNFLNTQFHAPVILYAEVEVDKKLLFWHLIFKYPETCLPEGEKGADQRRLGVFLKAVILTKISTLTSNTQK